MSSFAQWLQTYQKNKTVKQLNWICGSETVLVEEVVDTIRDSFEIKEWNLFTFVAGEDNERDIWNAIYQHPIDARTQKLVIVRNAEKLKKPERIVEWATTKNTNPLACLVFVANTPALERVEQTREMKLNRTKPPLVPYLEAIKTKATLVECRPFTQATAKHAVTWVESKVKIRRGVAGHLLNRSNGNLRLVRDAVRKLRVFPDEISEDTINLLLSEQPRSEFVDALLALDKKTALLALESVPFSEYGKIIGSLDQRLDVIGTVHDMLISHHTLPQISAALGTMGFLAKDFMSVSKSYDQKRRLALRQMLSVADEAVRGGIKEGPLEMLVHYW